MEVKGIDRVVIAKPVASRPSSTGSLLSGNINSSPPPGKACSEMAVAAIRPKTVRVKPTIYHSPQAENIQASLILSSMKENNFQWIICSDLCYTHYHRSALYLEQLLIFHLMTCPGSKINPPSSNRWQRLSLRKLFLSCSVWLV